MNAMKLPTRITKETTEAFLDQMVKNVVDYLSNRCGVAVKLDALATIGIREACIQSLRQTVDAARNARTQ